MKDDTGEPQVAVRRLAPDEWPAYRVLRLEMLLDTPEAFATTYAQALALTDEEWRDRLLSGVKLWAEVDGRPAGTVGLWVGPEAQPLPDGAVYLVAMYVAPWSRQRGVGGALVDAAVEEAGAQGFTVVELEVTSTNSAAIALYRSKGFVLTGTSRPHPALDGFEELAMRRVL